MDPNAAIAELHRILTRNPLPTGADLDRAAELADAVQVWLERGGFAPDPEHVRLMSNCLFILTHNTKD